MNTNTKELNLNELETISGGFDPKRFFKNCRLYPSDVAKILMCGAVGYATVGKKVAEAVITEFND